MKIQPSVERLRELFSYDDGKLIRRIPVSGNSAGSVVGCLRNNGYLQTCVDYKQMLNHRIIFALHHGYIPRFVDHVDGNKLNNKIENLREATKVQNGWNSKAPKTNTSGVKGVDWSVVSNKWRARCRVSGVVKHIGLFDTIEQAKNAVENYRNNNHGEFARHG